jgi:hypothetical protein
MTLPDPIDNNTLYRMLHEDTGSADEAAALLPAMQRLRRWSAPQPSSESTQILISRLMAEPLSAQTRHQQLVLEWWPLLLIRAQIRVVHREIWAASALVIILGVIITLPAYIASAGTVIPLALLAPVVAAVGIALLYDADMQPILELENATLASTRLLMLARLVLVFSFNLVLALAGSLVLSLSQLELSLWPLVLSWLAPMTFLSALAFLLSVILADSLAGSIISLGLWGLHVFLHHTAIPITPLATLFSFPGLSHPANYPTLFLAAAGLITLALWLVGRHNEISGLTH